MTADLQARARQLVQDPRWEWKTSMLTFWDGTAWLPDLDDRITASMVARLTSTWGEADTPHRAAP